MKAMSDGPQEMTARVGQISAVMPGIGPDMHRVEWVTIIPAQQGWWRRSALQLEAPCGMKMRLPGTRYQPKVGEVTCQFCLEASDD